MSFKIQITNNENGEVLVNEENAVAIIGGYSTEKCSAEIAFVSCSTLPLCNAITSAKKTINRVQNTDKRISLALELIELLKEKEEKNNDE